MLFTSIIFSFFLFLVFILYWVVFNRNLKGQNLFLLVSSYFFYGWWDWRFLSLLFLVSVFNYSVAVRIQVSNQKSFRKLLFITGLAVNVVTLGVFKYYNFFVNELIQLISLLGIDTSLQTLNVILPIGISFYIFLALSYIIDVYQCRLSAVRNLLDVLLTFAFFPIILAGPIQRPIDLLPQIQTRRIFSYAYATDGLRQILWGVFMKIVIADRCAVIANMIFADFSAYSGSTLIVGMFLFTVQIYADFAGYSNISIGVAKLLGFNVMRNFSFPYFSRDIREFWKRWNISLTTWFRDYVFLPIAYSVSRNIQSDRCCWLRTDFLIYIIGISVTWMLTGLWHGANYTFIVWGLIHGFFLIINHVLAKPRKRFLSRLHVPNDNVFLVMADSFATFIIIMFSWVFFRADDVGHALRCIAKIFSTSSFTVPEITPKTLFLVIALFFGVEWIGRKQEYAIATLGLKWPRPVRWAMYYGVVLAIVCFSGDRRQFIYFQF